MKNADVVIDILVEKIKDLELQVRIKGYRIEELENKLAEKEGKTDDKI